MISPMNGEHGAVGEAECGVGDEYGGSAADLNETTKDPPTLLNEIQPSHREPQHQLQRSISLNDEGLTNHLPPPHLPPDEMPYSTNYQERELTQIQQQRELQQEQLQHRELQYQQMTMETGEPAHSGPFFNSGYGSDEMKYNFASK